MKFILYFVLSLFIASCAQQPESYNPDVLRVSVQPHRDAASMKIFYIPLMDYLEHELKLKIQWVYVEHYHEQLEQFHRGEIDLALLGGYAYIKALERDNADALVMRDIDFRFTSYFLVDKENKAKNISQLKGSSFSFGSELSTSGHIMPRFFLSTQDIIPESFFSKVLYSGGHDKTAMWVQQRKVDVGVVNSVVINRLFKEQIINKNNLRVLWETPSYPDYVWAARKELPETLKAKIIEAFIKLSVDNKKDSQLLQKMGAHHYFPANSDDFEPIKKIAYQLGMLKND